MSLHLGGTVANLNAGVDVSLKDGISAHLTRASASAVLKRTLTFKTNNLGIEATLMLTFDNKIDGMYNDKFPVCWKAIKFPSIGPYQATVTYQGQIAFCKPQVDNTAGTIVDAGTFTKIDVGQKTTLKKNNSGVYNFSSPEPDAGSTTLKAHNGTENEEDMCIGLVRDGNLSPTPVLFFKGVGSGMSVQGDFTPILRAYVTFMYQETEIIRGEIITPVIWVQDLSVLEANTAWEFKFDPSSDTFTITKA